MLDLLLKLLLAHFLGDFIFQSEKWVKEKERRKLKSPFFYYHILVHTIVLMCVLEFDFSYWFGILAIILSHFIFDFIKITLKSKYSSRLLFVIDQLAHLSIILLTTFFYFPIDSIIIGQLYAFPIIPLVLSLVLLTGVSAVIMKVFMSKWVEDVKPQESLKAAGTYIGILERLLVFVFVVVNHWEGIGFLLAAKSIFRFGDLSNAKDRKLTEYVMVGSLLKLWGSYNYCVTIFISSQGIKKTALLSLRKLL